MGDACNTEKGDDLERRESPLQGQGSIRDKSGQPVQMCANHPVVMSHRRRCYSLLLMFVGSSHSLSIEYTFFLRLLSFTAASSELHLNETQLSKKSRVKHVHNMLLACFIIRLLSGSGTKLDLPE